MSQTSISIHVVNHLQMDMACPAETVWRDIVGSFVEGRRWLEQGYAVEPLDDPAAVLGGYRMRLLKPGAADERIVRVTERDEAERRLSLFVDFVSAPHGVEVFATYHAKATAGGTRYLIDCHTKMGIETPGAGSKADIAAVIDEMKGNFQRHLSGYLGELKRRFEQTQGDAS